MNEDTDFTAILRRRLFTEPPAADLAAATAAAVRPLLADSGWSKVFAALECGVGRGLGPRWSHALTRSTRS